MGPATILAFGVVHGALLWGLGLAAVPIIIHLFSRRRYRRVRWGAMRFLLDADKKNRKRVRFEQLLLLLLRCLAMALLALMVARPFVRPGLVASMLGARGQVHRVIVIDDSASLAHGLAAEAEFYQLRGAVDRLLSWLSQEAAGDPVSIYLTSRPEEPAFSTAHLSADDLQELRAKIESLEPTPLRARPRRTLTALAGALAAAGDRMQADLYVFSDFQRSDWIAAGDQNASASVFDALRDQSAADVRVILIAAGAAKRDNAGIVAIEMERPQTVAGIPVVVRIDVANFSPRTLRDVQLRLDVDGGPLPIEPIESIGPNSTKTVSTEIAFVDDGFRELRASIEALDHFNADDIRRAAIRVSDTLRALIVNGQPALDPYEDEVFLLRNALAPQGRVWSGIRTQVIDPSEIETTDLNTFDCVFLCNTPAPADTDVEALERYVRAGGGLVIFVGEEIGGVESYNQRLWRDGRGLLPLPLVQTAEPVGNRAGVGLVRDNDHLITSMFAGDVLSEYVHFRKFIECDETRVTEDPHPDQAVPVVLARYADANETPAIIEKQLGRGRIVLFTSTCDLEWNDWARSVDGSYLVAMQETMQSTARRNQHPSEFTAGAELAVQVFPDLYELSVDFKSPKYPDEPAVPAIADEAAAKPGEMVVLSGPPAALLGTYQAELSRRSGKQETRLLCVNLDPKESELAVASEAQIDAMMNGMSYEFIALSDGFLNESAEARHELWASLLIIVTVLLMTEQGLAWWFGGGRIAVPAAAPRLAR